MVYISLERKKELCLTSFSGGCSVFITYSMKSKGWNGVYEWQGTDKLYIDEEDLIETQLLGC